MDGWHWQDLEPDSSQILGDPLRLTNISFRDCVATNNSGAGFGGYFLNVPPNSYPLSVSFDNCSIRGGSIGTISNQNANGTYYTIGEFSLQSCPLHPKVSPACLALLCLVLLCLCLPCLVLLCLALPARQDGASALYTRMFQERFRFVEEKSPARSGPVCTSAPSRWARRASASLTTALRTLQPRALPCPATP